MNLHSKHETRRRLIRGMPESDMLHNLDAQWYRSPQGREVLHAEREVIKPLLEKLFGYHILQVGFSEEHSLIESSPVGHKVIFAPSYREGSKTPVAENEELPLGNDSIDVVLVHHALDFTDNSHRLLREMTRVLRPGGHMIIVGFNPYSSWGLWKLFKRRTNVPWRGRFISKGRVADWLKLLDLEIDSVSYGLHFLPSSFSRLLKSAKRLEAFGRKIHSPIGGAYYIHCVNQHAPITPILPRWNPLPARAASLPAAENVSTKIH